MPRHDRAGADCVTRRRGGVAGALGEAVEELTGRLWCSDREPLRDVAAKSAQMSPLRARLDSLGDDERIERVGEVDGSADDGIAARVVREVRDEAPVELDLLERQPVEVRERRVARAEVVDRESCACSREPVQRLVGALGVCEQRALGDLEHEVLRKEGRRSRHSSRKSGKSASRRSRADRLTARSSSVGAGACGHLLRRAPPRLRGILRRHIALLRLFGQRSWAASGRAVSTRTADRRVRRRRDRRG